MLALTQWVAMSLLGFALFLFMFFFHAIAHSTPLIYEPVQACVIDRQLPLTKSSRYAISRCLGWKTYTSSSICHGSYEIPLITPLANADEIKVLADRFSFYNDKPAKLSGHVEIQQSQRIVNAQTAYVYRDPKTNQVTKIELLGAVRYLEPGKLMIARKAVINPQDKSGTIEDVLYLFDTNRSRAVLPAWGRAGIIKRFQNQDYLLSQATYTTCTPEDKSWEIRAQKITIDKAQSRGVARQASLRIHDWPVFYTPYLSFPTNKERKSGFLMPVVDYSNIGGINLGLPYYWNIAPNYDLTVVPQIYTKRGVMLGGDYRFLTSNSSGVITGNFLPKDRAYRDFLQTYETDFPWLRGNSTNRWAYGVHENTQFSPDLFLNINVQQVSDDYYLQDFSSNLAVMTQRQLLRQADLTYTTDHWLFRGMGQSYQTLHPINETPIKPAYERLPQFLAHGYYDDLPFNANLRILGQYDQFHWPSDRWEPSFYNDNWQFFYGMPQGPRFHLNPILTLPIMNSWAYVTPSIQLVENYYDVQNSYELLNHYWLETNSTSFNRTIPRYSIDSGLYFDRNFGIAGHSFTQTLEPRLFYLRVPFQNQTPIPVYDSGFMIFNVDQLFRTNRFSGFDRIGDANQLAYALTSRWLSDDTGVEIANVTLGQIKYFSNRKVQLCQSITGFCIDNPYIFGGLSSIYGLSPIASRAVYHINPIWDVTGDYIWDPATRATNNADLNFHFQPQPKVVITAGYSYLVNGDITQVRNNGLENNALHQAIAAFALPINDKWSTLGAYSHNISKNYSMMTLFGVQYDSCCWAMRVLGGRTFKNLNAGFEPQYNSNVYLQFLLKGLGSAANSDPNNILSTYIPGYNDLFSH